MARKSVASREYKVMLRASRFAASEAKTIKVAQAFWQDFKKATGKIAVDTDGDLWQVKDRRLIRFYDTAGHHLKTSRYIFRERRDLVRSEREVTLKFRHADRYVAQDRNMDAQDGADPRTKFEEDIKIPFVSLYSFSATQRIGKDKNVNSLKDVARMFPGVRERLDEFPDDEALVVVNDFTARELVLCGAELELAKHPDVKAECALIVWYDQEREDSKPVVVEFSYRYGDKNEDYVGVGSRRAYEVFEALQNKLTRWVDTKSSTKTSFVYS